MTDAFFNAQQAIYSALAASSEVQSFIGSPVRVYDHVPPGAVFPYVTFGDVRVVPYDTKGESGFEQIVTLNVWSRYRGSKEGKDILQALYNVLHRASLSVSGHVFLFCEFHSADMGTDGDGITYQVAARFAVVTQGS